MRTYHRLIIEGENYYREYCHGLQKYHEVMTEQELMEILLEEAVEDEIEINQARIENAVRRITDRDDRELLNSYICYLERIINE
ncbi:hypothetical protein IMZ08_07395 [Bacillus luteolus]|uniref:Uncharacterized protein n=1 Tax=Litchfieldia luteola TaxID=682179 RepID=A0ABR9QHB2_9BACI|nr:hypothetical protein [Cytobacillus luteolus]MBE4907877.1 hypothetical protein [Cytobacillus luteolus]MBP1943965.1 3-methyladenine DNA glycosylase/8-oxoguanine DNA glycosylase [Cytobacillus luteolus]